MIQPVTKSIDIACPVCPALANEGCGEVAGQILQGRFHVARVTAAQKVTREHNAAERRASEVIS